jgi:hypothetical protein
LQADPSAAAGRSVIDETLLATRPCRLGDDSAEAA